MDVDAEFSAYVAARRPQLFRAACLLCGDPHRAEDIVQDALVRLYRAWDRVSSVENVDAYVHSMMVRVFLDEKRRGWWKVRLFGSPPERPAESPGALENRTVVRAALDRLPPRQQAVLVLRFLCDLPVAEVAEILDCSAGTVKSQTSHGLDTLRKILGERVPARSDGSK